MATFDALCKVKSCGHDGLWVEVLEGPSKNVTVPEGQLMIREVVLFRPDELFNGKCRYKTKISTSAHNTIVNDLYKIGDFKNSWIEATLTIRLLNNRFDPNSPPWSIEISGVKKPEAKRNDANVEIIEEETKMNKKSDYARDAARRYTEYRQRRDQMKAPVPPAIMDIKFSGPATIIFWGDGTKTVVKQQDGEAAYDKEKAIAMALIKKSYPGHAYHKLFNLNEYFGKQLRAAEKKRDNILSQIKDARKPRVLARLEQELYKIDDEIARLKKEVEKFE